MSLGYKGLIGVRTTYVIYVIYLLCLFLLVCSLLPNDPSSKNLFVSVTYTFIQTY